jgi:3-dehydroquinate dehydratase II
VKALCNTACAELGLSLDFRQSNHEGVLIDAIHDAGAALARGELLGCVFNAGAYTHTSVALHDAIKGSGLKCIELHISNVHSREAFRHHSYLSAVCAGVICGLGVNGYALAIRALAEA